jgi:hypothetical protein
VLGPIDELGVLELVGAGALDLLVHLFQPVHVGFGAKSVASGSEAIEGGASEAILGSHFLPVSLFASWLP